MKYIFTFFLFSINILGYAQSSPNDYVFTTHTNATLYAMNNADTLLGGNVDNMTDDSRLLPFPFAFLGSIHNSFSVSAHGVVYLSSLGGSNNYFQLIPLLVGGNSNNYKWSGNGMGTSKNGAVICQTFGSEPNRQFVISYEKMSLSKRMGNDDASFQVVLHEGSGVVQFIYGIMKASDTLLGVGYPALSKTSTNQHRNVDISTHTSSFSTTTPWTGYTINPGNITGLHSPVNGSCRTYIFTPPAIPSYVNTQLVMTPVVSGVAAMTIPEYNAAYSYFYRVSTSASGPFGLPTLLSSNLIHGVTDSTLYYRLYRSNGAAISSNYASGSVTYPSGRKFISQNSGFWSAPTTWGISAATQPPTWGDTVIVDQGDTVRLDVFGTATAQEMVVSGVLDYGSSLFNPFTVVNMKVDITGLVRVHNGSTASSPNSISGGTLIILGNLTGAGKVDMRYNNCKLHVRSIDTVGSHIIDINFEQANNSVPLLNTLILSSYKDVYLLKPLTINKEILGLHGTMVTNNNLIINRMATVGTQSPPSAVSIYRYSREPLFDGSVSYAPNSSPDLYYMGNLQFYTNNTPFKVAPFLAGSEVPANDSVNLLKVTTNAGVDFIRPITVTHTMEWQNGHVNMINGSDFILAGTNFYYESGGVRTNGWVKYFQYQYPFTGLMNTPGNSNVYPIITNGMKRFAFLQGALSADGFYSVKHSYLPGTATFASPFTENGNTFTKRSNSFWQVSSPTGNEFANNAFHFRAGDIDSIADYQLTAVCYANGAAAGSHLATLGGNGDPIVARTGLNSTNISTNNFYIAFANASPLSSALLSFDGVAKDIGHVLNWKLTEHHSLTNAELQKSRDGKAFERLDGISLEYNRSHYKYVDGQPFEGSTFYRLKLTDENLKPHYSNTVMLLSEPEPPAIQCVPNPATEYILLSGSNTSFDSYTIYDALGKARKSGTPTSSGSSYTIAIKDLSDGAYFVRLYNNGHFIHVIKFMKVTQ